MKYLGNYHRLNLKSLKLGIFLFTLFCTFPHSYQINEGTIGSSKSWCWTKPVINDPNFILNSNIGGTNWGFCKQSTSHNLQKKEYTIYIRTSALPNSSTEGTIMISLQGSEGTSKEILLSNSGFKAGAFDKIKIFSEDIGNLYNIKLIAKGRITYRCSDIRIESEMNFWNFECDQPLKWPKSMIELSVSNGIDYNINVKTNSNNESGTMLPVYISLIGPNGKTPFKLLSNKGFAKGSLIYKSIKTIDIDIIKEIVLKVNGNDEWIPEEIVIKKGGNDSTSSHSEFIFKNGKNESAKGLQIPLKLPVHKDDASNNDSNSSGENSVLDSNELNNVIKLSCNEIMKDNENFGPSFNDHNVNYMNFIAECPSDCLFKSASSLIYGLGIHPEESPICGSALVDRAVSLYGGIISISIYNGLNSYTGGGKIFSLSVSSFSKSKRSYTIGRIDNIDMIDKDVRILDTEGKMSNKGRVEMKANGIWGTICAVGLDSGSSNVLCKQLGYKGGKYLNPKENSPNAKGFCRNYNGLNFCGVENSKVLFSNGICQGNEESIGDCSRESVVPSSTNNSLCNNNNHQYDTLVECDNIEEESFVSFKLNTVRLINAEGNPTQNGIGRLEILRSSWGTICDVNNNFDSNAASVACKQMGYGDGELFEGSRGNCNNILGNNLCGELSQPIKGSDITCKGHEQSIKDCKTNDITLNCNHSNDIILKCTGGGDPTGKSQNNATPKIIIPPVQKLPLSPVYNAKCESTGKNIYFRGDPGSVFLVNCPTDCDGENNSVYGTGIYTRDSSICKSAIQSGVITKDGGEIVVVKTYGQNKYYGNNLRGISSGEDNGSNIAFFITQINSGYSNGVEMYNSMASFIEVNTGTGKSNKDSDMIFVAPETTKDSKALFEWAPTSNTFKFENSYVDLNKYDNSSKGFHLKTFTLFVKLKMMASIATVDSDSVKQIVFSIGGCEGGSVVIDSKNEGIVDERCSSNGYASGIYVPNNSFITFAIVFDGLRLYYYLNNKKIYEQQVALHLQFTKYDKITLGKSSEYDSDFFHGVIKFFVIFNEAFDIKRIGKLFTTGYTHPDKASQMKNFTLDNRNCISSCFNMPIPGHPGCPIPPTEAITYEVNGDKTILPNSFGSKDGQADGNLDPYIEVKCSTTTREVFKSEIKVGDKIRVKCPDDCSMKSGGSYKGGIYGTGIYSFDSLICGSAAHAGLVTYNEISQNDKDNTNKYTLGLHSLPGMTFYQGSLQYNVQSTSIENCDYSFSVEIAPPVIQIECTTSSSDDKFSNTLGMKFLVKCPEKCSRIPHRVYGSGIYSGDSSICQSAIHSGAGNDRGGEIQFEIAGGRKIYFGKKAFGIESKERDSYVKSIQFFSNNNNLFTIFKEKCDNSNGSKNWDTIDDLKANVYPSKWECIDNPFKSNNNINSGSTNYNNKNEFIIKQSKPIKSLLPGNYGSILSLKNTDVVNSLYKVSFYFSNLSPVGILFRYKDENNFYHGRINNLSNSKIVLFKRFEGKTYTLATSTISIIPRVWYTFTLKLFYEKFFIFVQIGELRNTQQIIAVTDNDIQRGGGGVGTDGNDDFYINNIGVDDYDLSKDHGNVMYDDNAYSFEMLLKDNTDKSKDKYCKALNEQSEKTMHECKEYHRYCRLRCNEMFHIRENILNYSCYKSCVNDTINKEKIKFMYGNQQINKEVSGIVDGDGGTGVEAKQEEIKLK